MSRTSAPIDPSLGFAKASDGTRFRVQRRETDHRSNGTKYPRGVDRNRKRAWRASDQRKIAFTGETRTGWIRLERALFALQPRIIAVIPRWYPLRVHHQFVRARTESSMTINFIYRKSLNVPNSNDRVTRATWRDFNATWDRTYKRTTIHSSKPNLWFDTLSNGKKYSGILIKLVSRNSKKTEKYHIDRFEKLISSQHKIFNRIFENYFFRNHSLSYRNFILSLK